MKIEPFELERLQSKWEHQVKYNISESGVHPLLVKDLLCEGGMEELVSLRLGYAQTNGPAPLRDRISLLYPGADIENILVTSGSAEANFLATWSALDAGDDLVYMVPNYVQIYGLADAFGATVKPFHLREDLAWAPSLDQLKKLVTSRTKMIAVCNPNNPTGAVLTEDAMTEIVCLAKEVGAWILSDEVYRGAELDRKRTPTFWGRYDKVIVISGLSKAFGLPGLRIGWIVGPKDFVESAWGYHDYSTITASTISFHLAYLALEPEMREKILNRSQDVVNENLHLLREWIGEHGDLFRLVPPKAGAMAFLHYNLPVNSTELVTRLFQEKSVLVVPGDVFGLDHYIRIGYGVDKECLLPALNLISELVSELR